MILFSINEQEIKRETTRKGGEVTKRDAKGRGEEGEKEEAGAFEVKAAFSSFRFQC